MMLEKVFFLCLLIFVMTIPKVTLKHNYESLDIHTLRSNFHILQVVCLAILVTYSSGLGIQRQFDTVAPPDAKDDTSIEELKRQFNTQAPPDARQDGSIEEIEQRWDEPDENGEYLIDDMRLDEVQFKGLFGTEEDMELLRNALPGNRWTDGVLPYKFDSGVTEENKNKVRQAMADFNQHLSECINVR